MSVILRGPDTCILSKFVPCGVCAKREEKVQAEHLAPYKGVYIPVCSGCLDNMQTGSEYPVIRALRVQEQKPKIGLDWG